MYIKILKTRMTPTDTKDFSHRVRMTRPNEQRESERIQGVAGAHTHTFTQPYRVRERPTKAASEWEQRTDIAPPSSVSLSVSASVSLSLHHDPTTEVHQDQRRETIGLAHRCRRDQSVWSS